MLVSVEVHCEYRQFAYPGRTRDGEKLPENLFNLILTKFSLRQLEAPGPVLNCHCFSPTVGGFNS